MDAFKRIIETIGWEAFFTAIGALMAILIFYLRRRWKLKDDKFGDKKELRILIGQNSERIGQNSERIGQNSERILLLKESFDKLEDEMDEKLKEVELRLTEKICGIKNENKEEHKEIKTDVAIIKDGVISLKATIEAYENTFNTIITLIKNNGTGSKRTIRKGGSV